MAAVLTFLGVAAVGLAVLGTDRYVHRAVQIPAPAYADSLKGVVVRVAGYGDSTVAVTYWQSPESWLGLNWISTDAYRYRDSTLTGTGPMVGYADLSTSRITFAKGQLTVELVKHELTHLVLHVADHPADVFQRIEQYRGP